MTAYQHNLTEDATYWSPAGNTADGRRTFNAPVAVKVRWQRDQQLARDQFGREFVTDSIVYVDRSIDNGGYLYRGESAAASPVDGAQEIRGLTESPSLDGAETLHKALL